MMSCDNCQFTFEWIYQQGGVQFVTALTMHSFSGYYYICFVVYSEVSRRVKVVFLLIQIHMSVDQPLLQSAVRRSSDLSSGYAGV